MACCMDFKQFHMHTALDMDIDLKICQIIYVVIRSFFKYLVCNVKPSVFERTDYHRFFVFSLSFFAVKFMQHKNRFKQVCKIIKAKMIKLKQVGDTKFHIN